MTGMPRVSGLGPNIFALSAPLAQKIMAFLLHPVLQSRGSAATRKTKHTHRYGPYSEDPTTLQRISKPSRSVPCLLDKAVKRSRVEG